MLHRAVGCRRIHRQRTVELTDSYLRKKTNPSCPRGADRTPLQDLYLSESVRLRLRQ